MTDFNDIIDETFDKIKDDIQNIDQSKLKNYIAIILDKSGSMDIMAREVVDAFNEQVKVINKTSGQMKTLVSLITFGSKVNKPLLWCEDHSKIKPLEYDQYIPSGMTALNDAIGYTITRLNEQPDANDKDVSFLMIIISDGQENNSHEYSPSKIMELIKAQQKTDRWTFTYLGANQNMEDISRDYGILAANTISYTYSSDGMRESSNNMSNGIAKYMSNKARGINTTHDFYSDDK